jgi:competence protein ComEA
MNPNTLTKRRSGLRDLTAALALAIALATAGSARAADAAPVDLNSATLEQLQALPGIGPAKAQAIVDERKNGKFVSVDDLERVKGIGPATLADLREHVTAKADPPKPEASK